MDGNIALGGIYKNFKRQFQRAHATMRTKSPTFDASKSTLHSNMDSFIMKGFLRKSKHVLNEQNRAKGLEWVVEQVSLEAHM